MNFIKYFKKVDIIIILLLIITALILSVFAALKRSGNGNVYAEIIYSGNIVCTVDLNANRTFSVPELPNILFEIKDGRIAFIKSDCPDKICVKTGFISKPEQTAACLPNKTVLHIKQTKNKTGSDDIDTIVR